jgi:hypothetical protein
MKEELVIKEEIALKQDSFTIGAPSKEGSLKVYFDMQTSTDEDLAVLVKRAIGLWKIGKSVSK